MWGSWAKGTIKHSPFTIYHKGWQKGAPWMAVTALLDADAAAFPDGWSFCVEAALSLSRSSSPAHPPLPSCSPSSAQLPHSSSPHPASPQLAAATVAACLLHLLYIFPIFCLFPLPLFSSLLTSGLWNFQYLCSSVVMRYKKDFQHI